MRTLRQQAQVPPLSSVAVEGFKSLRDRTEIELRPLTLLAGRNSSGKSSLMQPLLLMKQTLEAPFDSGPLLLDGPHVQFASSNELFWNAERDREDRRLIVEFYRRDPAPSDLDSRLAVRLAPGETDAIKLESQFFRVRKGGVKKGRDAYEKELREGSRLIQQPGWSKDPELRKFVLGKAEPLPKVRVRRNRCFLEYVLKEEGFEESFVPPKSLSISVRRAISFLLHLPGLRGSPARAYPATGEGRRSVVSGWRAFQGPFHPYTASVLASWQDQKDERVEALGEQLTALGLTWKAQARRVDATRIEVQVARLAKGKNGSGDLVNIADVGVGVSQTLPLLVALLTAQSGQIVYVEQPEIHLHPAAQRALAGCLVAAAKRGVCVIAETHSDLLLKGVLTEVATGELDPKLVKLYWLERDDDGATRVTPADVDERGTFGDWPVDFDAVELEAEDRYLAASMAPRPTGSSPGRGLARGGVRAPRGFWKGMGPVR